MSLYPTSSPNGSVKCTSSQLASVDCCCISLCSKTSLTCSWAASFCCCCPKNQPILASKAAKNKNAKCGIFGTNPDRKSTRLNSSHVAISYAVFCLKKKTLENRNN